MTKEIKCPKCGLKREVRSLCYLYVSSQMLLCPCGHRDTFVNVGNCLWGSGYSSSRGLPTRRKRWKKEWKKE